MKRSASGCPLYRDTLSYYEIDDPGKYRLRLVVGQLTDTMGIAIAGAVR